MKILRNCILLALSAFMLYGCGDNKTNDTTTTGKNESAGKDIIKTDASGKQVLNLKMAPEKGETFYYKMIARTNTKEKSPQTQDKEITTEQVMSYYFSQEVSDINETGVITFKVKFDSINISSKVMSPDSTLSEVYNSNIKDSTYNKTDFIQYNALIGNAFKMRVSPRGEIYEVYELEAVHNNIFKSLGDTLKEQDKAMIKESMGSEAIKGILQNQFQKFAEHDVPLDSNWSFTNETQLLVFPVRNILNYKVTELKDNNTIAVINAALAIEFIEKEQKQKQMTVAVDRSDANGTGTILFNLDRGCIQRKETNTKVDLTLKLSAQGQSAKSDQLLTTNLVVELLK